MKLRLVLIFVIAFSLAAFAQGKGKGGGKGHGSSSGQSAGQSHGHGHDDSRDGQGRGHGRDDVRHQGKHSNDDDYGWREHERRHAGPLDAKKEKTGAFRMLQRKTGMSAEQLRALYRRSNAKNFGQFVSGIVAARNNNLREEDVLGRMRNRRLEDVLLDLGLPRDRARDEVRKALREIQESEAGS